MLYSRGQDMNSGVDNGFVYSFDISEQIPCFKNMPEHIKVNAECNVVEVIYEAFVVPGDQDYLVSRLLGQKGLPRGFFWAAAQATEKYLKAFLLMNGKSVIRYNRHPIKELFEGAKEIDNSIAGINISPHPSIEVDPRFHRLRKFTIQVFIDELEKHGCADNRYNTFGVEYNTGHLLAMDSLSFQLRRKIGVIPITESFRTLSPDLLTVFKAHNPWFQACIGHSFIGVQRAEFPIEHSMSTTKIQRLTKFDGNAANSIALQWLRKNMKLPKEGKK